MSFIHNVRVTHATISVRVLFSMPPLLRGVIANKNTHSTEVASPPPPPRVCMSIHPEGESNVMLRFRLECSFSTTLLPGEPLSEIMRFSVKSTAASIPKVDGVAGWVAATNEVGPARNPSIKGQIYNRAM